jgi:DnaJ like chaperone protein
MAIWGKIIGGMAGFAMGGPVGALFGAAMGHAADEGNLNGFSFAGRPLPFESTHAAAMLGRRDQIFAVGVTVLAAKLAKCDGPVGRVEIDAFRRSFAIPEGSVAEVGRLFDSARESAAGFESYAVQMGQAFSDNPGILEQVLAGLYQIARADGPVNAAEADFLSRVAHGFGLDLAAAQRAGRGGAMAGSPVEDPYAVLGLKPQASREEIRARWKTLMRENHPDTLSAKGVPAAMVKQASDRVARINAAYDAIKRERKF